MGGVREVWTDEDIVNPAIGAEIFFAAEFGGEGAGEGSGGWSQSSHQVDETSIEDFGDAAVIELAGVQVLLSRLWGLAHTLDR